MNIEQPTQIDQEIETPKKTVFKKLGEFHRKISGGAIYAYHHPTRTLGKVLISSSETGNRIDLMADCGYIEALNMENAMRKLKAGKFIFVT